MFDFILATKDNPREAFRIGSLSVEWYGLIIVIGMIVGLAYACWQSKKVGLTPDDIIELFLWLIPLAIVFARLLYVLPRFDEYFGNKLLHGWEKFVHIIAIWEGGITIIGGLLGGLIGAVFFSLRHKKQTNFLNVVDLVVVPVFLGQIIGRWGNFVNQEAFGLPITNKALQFFPFGVYITDPSGVSGDFKTIVDRHIRAGGGGNWFCATFFYEGVWNAIGVAIAVALWRKDYQKKYPGILMIFYLFWYCLGRFWLEFLRMDAVPVTKTACIIVSVIALVIGIVYVIARNSKLAYSRLRALASSGEKGAYVSEYEIANYERIGKIFASANTQSDKAGKKIAAFFAMLTLKICYVRKDEKDYLPLDRADVVVAKKGYKKRLKNIQKTATYQL